MTLYSKIIEQQINNKNYYINNVSPPRGGICIIMKDNIIHKIVDGNGWVHPTRKRQYISLITNVIEKYTLKDCNININISDHPIQGYFNFCRNINNNSQFLLPNHRFTNDDIVIDKNKQPYKNFNEQKKYIFNINKDNKINKIFTSCIPHRSKTEYFSYAINNSDICDGYCYTGSGHKLCNLPYDMYLELKNRGMAGEEYSYWINHLDYKYVLYNDGNTLSDRLRLLLTTNSVIIKKSNSPYEEFYSYILDNNKNYIEYSNINEIRNIYNKLENNSELYNQIIKNNRDFIHKYLDYDEILLYTYKIIDGITN